MGPARLKPLCLSAAAGPGMLWVGFVLQGCPTVRAQRGFGAASSALCDSHGRGLASGVAQGWAVVAQPLPGAAEPGLGRL